MARNIKDIFFTSFNHFNLYMWVLIILRKITTLYKIDLSVVLMNNFLLLFLTVFYKTLVLLRMWVENSCLFCCMENIAFIIFASPLHAVSLISPYPSLSSKIIACKLFFRT